VLASFNYAHSSLGGMPVCGVDDAGQIANEAFRENPDITATFVKSEIQADSGKVEDTAVFELIANTDVFCVHGASFGKTDGRWWRAIKERMLACGHAVLVISSHSFVGDYHVPLWRRQARDAAIGEFLDGCGAEGDARDQLIERSFVLPSSSLFVISEPLPFKGLSDDALKGIAKGLFGI